MEKNNFKNMLVLRNLPSNIVEEAIVIFKDQVSIKSVREKELKNNSNENNINKEIEKTKENNFVIKEAEIVVSDYIKKLESKKENINKSSKMKKTEIAGRYKKIKVYSSILTIFFLIENLILLCK